VRTHSPKGSPIYRNEDLTSPSGTVHPGPTSLIQRATSSNIMERRNVIDNMHIMDNYSNGSRYEESVESDEDDKPRPMEVVIPSNIDIKQSPMEISKTDMYNRMDNT